MLQPNDPEATVLTSGWHDARAADLFAAYRQILGELRERGIVRSDNAPAGDYAEYLVTKAFDGVLAAASEKSWDVLAVGRKIQVKCRVVSDPIGARQRQLSPFRSFDFDAAVIVLFRNTDYSVLRGVELPVDVVKNASVFRSHVNGHVVRATDALLTHESAFDLTELLNRAATGL